MLKQIFSTAVFTILLFFWSKAQPTYNEAEFKNKPVWISMMRDSPVNYYQAIRAFTLFWEDRVKPDEQEEEGKEHEKAREKKAQRRYEKQLSRMTAAERNEFDILNYQYKMFLHWQQEIRPFVNPDGSITKRYF